MHVGTNPEILCSPTRDFGAEDSNRLQAGERAAYLRDGGGARAPDAKCGHGGTVKVISVVVVAEVRLYRDAVARAVDVQHDLRLSGEADCAREALTVVARAQPDVLLIDLGTADAFDVLHCARTTAAG